ncbi:MAG: WG repeat-containing protein [Raineya sp.]|nr:WG repeat-containing protein [Raineya sp.]
MKKFCLIIYTCLGMLHNLSAQLMAERLVQNKKVGYQDLKEKKLVIPCEYEDGETYAVGNNVAVKKNGKWGLINEQNQVIVPFEYEMIYSTCGSTTSAQKNGKWGVIDITNNQIILPFEFEATGKVFIEKILSLQDESHTFSIKNPLIAVKLNGKWKFINKEQENTLIRYHFEDIDLDCSDLILDFGDTKMIMRGKRKSLPYVKFEGEWYEPRYNEEKEIIEFVDAKNAKISKRDDPNLSQAKPSRK